MSRRVKGLAQLYHDERGITGVETAIILIAFVVVASLFAFTVLSGTNSSFTLQLRPPQEG